MGGRSSGCSWRCWSWSRWARSGCSSRTGGYGFGSADGRPAARFAGSRLRGRAFLGGPAPYPRGTRACAGGGRAGARRAVEGLRDHLDRCGHGVQVAEVAGGYQLVSRARFFGVVRRAAGGVRRPVLSKAAIETLAIVAYRQPVSRADIEHLRGVNCEGPLGTLLERGLIEVAYRGDGPGRPVYYRTTRRFLEMFGLASLENLPPLDGPGAPAGMAGAPAAQTTEGHHGRGKQADGVP
ncbi:MAG: SMC-Scp complex subunit ScpB [Limnochordaceae bacterium]|nr:SMC-Scp complex subunit ScpB [Limnochordaceae bacterium]